MLDTIKQYIENSDDSSFGQFFQEYVMSIQDKIINEEIRQSVSLFHSVSDIPEADKCIDRIVESMLQS